MAEQLPSDSLTTLDDLKRAIEAVPSLDSGAKAYVYWMARAEAWRTAFEWRCRCGAGSLDWAEGMRLIREELK